MWSLQRCAHGAPAGVHRRPHHQLAPTVRWSARRQSRASSARPIAAAAATAHAPAIPHELALFPVQPIGVFTPGMTKTLHLYEPHFIALLEECLASPSRLMATAVLEPHMGDDAAADGGPGSFVGGNNFLLSCGCLVQLLSAKPYTGGYLVRIRGEARLGISGLTQTGPYMRAQVYPLPDQAASWGAEEEEALRARVQTLDDVMRDAQNLASKFRCDETAALQQAMRWRHAAPLTPGIQLGAAAATAAAAAAGGADTHASAEASAAASSSSSSSSSSSAGGSGSSVGQAHAGAPGIHAPHGVRAQQEAGEGEEEEEAFDPEEAVRLSWAAMQWLPHAGTEERMRIVRARLLAMDTRDTGRRLALAAEAMGEAAARLAAQCAVMGARA